MNKIELNQTGGFPLETDILDAMQTAYSLFNHLGELAGSTVILSGCEITGNTVANGLVYLNGELFTFRGGSRGTNVVIREDVENRVFEDGQSKPVYKTRYATFGTGVQQWPWANFQRVENLLALKQRVESSRHSIPRGLISMWSGTINNIPQGWALCDGRPGTPNLTDRFVVGAGGAYNVGRTGGQSEVTLSENQMPSHNHQGSTDYNGNHNHTGSTNSTGNHNHSYRDGYHIEAYASPNDILSAYESENVGHNFRGDGDTDDDNRYIWYKHRSTNWEGNHNHTLDVDYSGNHIHNITTENKGSGEAHENRPPYYALAFIMKL